MQQPAYLDVLKARYRFDEWKDAGPSAEAPVQALTFSGRELPGYRLVRQARREAAGHPPFVRSIWQGAWPAHLVGLDVNGCASPAAARDYLLQRLGDFQGPPLTRDASLGVGDVAFVLPGETVIAFARGAAVALVHNAGGRVEPIGGVARALDAILRGPGEPKP